MMPMLSFMEFQLALLGMLTLLVLGPLVACWRVCRRLGYAGAWSLLVLVPVVNVAAIWWLADVVGRCGHPSRRVSNVEVE